MGTSNRINEKDLLFSKPKNPTEHLIMYCKLLKYTRELQIRVPGDTIYRRICKNAFFPFIKTSPYPWDRQRYYAFWYHKIYGWMVVSLNRLNNVKL